MFSVVIIYGKIQVEKEELGNDDRWWSLRSHIICFILKNNSLGLTMNTMNN